MLERRLAIIATAAALMGAMTALKPAPAQAQVRIEYEVEPPVRVYSYPHTRYEDNDVYYARGRWYYQRGPRWYYYHREPPALRHHRTYVIERPRHRPRPVHHRHRSERREHREHRHRHVLETR